MAKQALSYSNGTFREVWR